MPSPRSPPPALRAGQGARGRGGPGPGRGPGLRRARQAGPAALAAVGGRPSPPSCCIGNMAAASDLLRLRGSAAAARAAVSAGPGAVTAWRGESGRPRSYPPPTPRRLLPAPPEAPGPSPGRPAASRCPGRAGHKGPCEEGSARSHEAAQPVSAGRGGAGRRHCQARSGGAASAGPGETAGRGAGNAGRGEAEARGWPGSARGLRRAAVPLAPAAEARCPAALWPAR